MYGDQSQYANIFIKKAVLQSFWGAGFMRGNGGRMGDAGFVVHSNLAMQYTRSEIPPVNYAEIQGATFY